MNRLVRVFGPLTRQQIIIAAVVLLAAAGITYGLSDRFFNAGTALASNQQVIPVETGNLVQQVSISGNLAYTDPQNLTFGTQGSVGQVLVQPGDTVVKGQLLARLDTSTVTTLQANVVQDQVNLENAQSNYDTLKSQPTEDDLAAAQSQLDSAKTALSSAQLSLSNTQKTQAANVSTAQDALATSTTAYAAVFQKWLGITPTGSEMDQSPEALLASWGINLDTVYSRQSSSTTSSGSDPFTDNPSTPWSEAVVNTWLMAYPGTIIPTCNSTTAIPPQGVCIQQEMDNAWNTYQTAQSNLENVQSQAAQAIANAQDGVTKAQVSLNNAQSNYDTVQAGPSASSLNLAQRQLDSAQQQLDNAQQLLDNAAMTSPIDGTVASVSISAGQNIGANATAIQVIDPTAIELDGTADEIDVPSLHTGMTANVALDALPGQALTGTLTSIGANSSNQSGVVTYPITIQVHVPNGTQLRAGLSATANIVIKQDNNVLLVPNQAIYGTFDQPVVDLWQNGKIVQQPVTLGDSDTTWTVVQSGLSSGDQIVMEGTAPSSSSTSGNGFRQIGSAIGGGGGFGGGTFTAGGGSITGGGTRGGRANGGG